MTDTDNELQATLTRVESAANTARKRHEESAFDCDNLEPAARGDSYVYCENCRAVIYGWEGFTDA